MSNGSYMMLENGFLRRRQRDLLPYAQITLKFQLSFASYVDAHCTPFTTDVSVLRHCCVYLFRPCHDTTIQIEESLHSSCS